MHIERFALNLTCRSVIFLGAWEIGYPSIDLTEHALFGYRRKAPTESLAGRLLRKHEVVAERQWVRHQPDNLVEYDYPYLTHDPFLSEPALSLSWGLAVTALDGPNLFDT